MFNESAWFNSNIAAGRHGPFSVIKELTPCLASIIMVRQTAKTKDRVVDRYKKAMIAGEWGLTGETVIISKEGTLCNGHHRCQAVMDSGTKIPMIFVFGIEKDVAEVTGNCQCHILRELLLQTLHKVAGVA